VTETLLTIGKVAVVGYLAAVILVYFVQERLLFAPQPLAANELKAIALRYPDAHELYVLDRRHGAADTFELRTDRIRARSGHLTQLPSVVFASERMDDNPAWRLLDAGELVHVDADLSITRRLAFPEPPRHLLRHSDLGPVAAAAQQDQGTR